MPPITNRPRQLGGEQGDKQAVLPPVSALHPLRFSQNVQTESMPDSSLIRTWRRRSGFWGVWGARRSPTHLMSPSWFWKRPSRPTRPSGVCLTHIASLYNSLLSNHLPPVLQWTSRWMERLRKSRMNGDWGVGLVFRLECVVVSVRLRWLMCSCVLPTFGVGCDLVVCLFRFALFCYIRQLAWFSLRGSPFKG